MKSLLYIIPFLFSGLQFLYPDTGKPKINPRPHNLSTFSSIERPTSPSILNSIILDSICTKKDFVTTYPDFYGGSFIDNNKLVFYFVGDSSEVMKHLKSFASDTLINFKKADFSYQYLLEIQNKFSDELKDFPDKIRRNVSGSNVDVIKNRFTVFLRNDSRKKINEIKKLLNNPAIQYEQMSGFVNDIKE